MKTKFILHGGFNSQNKEENNSDFYKEILKDAPENALILLVPFAKEEDRIYLATQKVTLELNRNKWQENIMVEIANEKEFLKQLQLVNIIYFHGGVSLKLLHTLKKYPALGEMLEGKTIAGESAGANVLGKFFYSPHADNVFEGLGILPIKIIPHYKEEYVGKLDEVGLGLKTILLPEYTFKIYKI